MRRSEEPKSAPSSYGKEKDMETHGLKEMRRKFLLIGIALALFFLAVWILFSGSFSTSGGIKSCGGIIFTVQRNSCYESLAKSTDNYSVCSFISTQPGSYS